MSKGGTATTSTGPASYLSSDYQGLANEASGLYGGITPQLPGFLNSGLASIQNATASNPIGSAAQNYYTNLENGSLLNPATNPNLQNMAQLADNQITNNLTSEFAGSGRNIEASAPVQASQMANVAADIYGGAYNNTMNNMTSGLGQASQLMNESLMPGMTQLGIPSSQLSAYGSLLGGMPGGTATTPYYQNPINNVLGGAQFGGTVGQNFGGTTGAGWGSLIGGLAGALA
ncbi:MAG: hypothetical protein KGL35_16960 [Bradyrhizobium sp.]|nr:hypothetical protein [Bradyrhizobium sp.]